MSSVRLVPLAPTGLFMKGFKMKYLILLFGLMIHGCSAHAQLVVETAFYTKTVTIANGATVSDAVATGGRQLVGIITPAALTGTAMTFSMSSELAGTYVPIKVTAAGTAFSQTVTTSSYYAIDPAITYGVPFIKATSGSAEGAARSIILVFKRRQ